MKLADVTVTSDLGKPWSEGLRATTSLDALRSYVETWRELAPDALDLVSQWRNEDFAEFKVVQAKEYRGEFAGEEMAAKYGEVLMPLALIAATAVSGDRGLPEGYCLLELVADGRFEKDEQGCLRAVPE